MASTVRPACSSARVRSKHARRRLVVEHRADVGVLVEHGEERAALLPGPHRGALHHPVRVVARQPGLDQREQDRLAEHEPVRTVEGLEHAVGVDDHAVDDRGELHGDVVRELQRVGKDDALDRRMRDVALVPERDVLEPRLHVGPEDACEPAELLALHRVALVGHRARALLGAGAERLLDLADLRALQVADLQRERLDRRAERRARVQQLGVAVTGENLGGRHGREAQVLADEGLDLGVDVRIGADRTGELADRDAGPGPGQALPLPPDLQRPQRQLGPEGRGLGVDPVGPTDHRGGPVLAGPAGRWRLRARPPPGAGGRRPARG